MKRLNTVRPGVARRLIPLRVFSHAWKIPVPARLWLALEVIAWMKQAPTPSCIAFGEFLSSVGTTNISFKVARSSVELIKISSIQTAARDCD